MKTVSDIRVVDQHVEVSGTLATPIYLSLFSWARAQPGDGVPDAADPQGWWGDTYADVPGDEFGSRLWTLVGRNITQALLDKAELLAGEALQWLLDDGLVTSLQVTAIDVGDNTIAFAVTGDTTDTTLNTTLTLEL